MFVSRAVVNQRLHDVVSFPLRPEGVNNICYAVPQGLCVRTSEGLRSLGLPENHRAQAKHLTSSDTLRPQWVPHSIQRLLGKPLSSPAGVQPLVIEARERFFGNLEELSNLS